MKKKTKIAHTLTTAELLSHKCNKKQGNDPTARSKTASDFTLSAIIPNSLIEFSLNSGQSVFINGRIFWDIDNSSLSNSLSNFSVSVSNRLRPCMAASGTLSRGDLEYVY